MRLYYSRIVVIVLKKVVFFLDSHLGPWQIITYLFIF